MFFSVDICVLCGALTAMCAELGCYSTSDLLGKLADWQGKSPLSPLLKTGQYIVTTLEMVNMYSLEI